MKRGYVICPKCGGTGIVTLDSGKKARCNFCYSSGEVPKEKTNQTNEKWFDTLSTEEKAEIIAQLSSYGGNVEAILDWLKGEHRQD